VTDRVYWFARRFPVGDPRNGLAPVHWKGFAVALGFVAGMLASAGAGTALAANGLVAAGIAVFAAGAAASGGAFIVIARRTADMTRTTQDYRAGRAP
jgi:nitrate reductase gamma subunit